MTVRPILQWPDKRLRTKVPEVSEITDEVREIWADMVDTMDAMPGVGLAATQIGVMMQLAVVDTSNDRKRRILMANPQVLEASAKPNEHEEASPCLPGVSAKITRPRAVSVRYLDEHGVISRREFVGLEATSVQHQIDHLAGRMYFDRLSKTKRDMLLRKAKKLGG
ncbi:Peptide deformylase [Sulfitobacter noctilucicola]|uniref:Peptide deformylase-like n=1 Tax=Sulfitobacter noctilucicola TaxID=1342301 RepID=A0A7W6M685_9RHOB|nr:peptide deformylase [Sulfitobacter noctilucicola]KIN62322.1 Peptide deformylase [Sulfitobacter noctilucicola]MBB4173144.1 peptide deformylase [Sulfitobacter noctilucicola]